MPLRGEALLELHPSLGQRRDSAGTASLDQRRLRSRLWQVRLHQNQCPLSRVLLVCSRTPPQLPPPGPGTLHTGSLARSGTMRVRAGCTLPLWAQGNPMRPHRSQSPVLSHPTRRRTSVSRADSASPDGLSSEGAEERRRLTAARTARAGCRRRPPRRRLRRAAWRGAC